MIEIIRGIVSSNNSVSKDGTFYAIFESLSDDPLKVTLTSPYYRVGGGGLLAIPNVGSQIVALYDDVAGDILYQSTVIAVEDVPAGEGYTDFNVIDPKFYNINDRLVKTTYQNNFGTGLEITRNHDPNPGSKIVNSVALKSEKGKKISLDDSPELDGVFIRNQHGDGLTIKGDPDKVLAGRTVILKSNGSQSYTCFEGQMELKVIDGRDIVVENNSTGSMAQIPSLDFWPNGPAEQPPKRYGGVYLRSIHGDVSMSSQANDGRVFIVTPNARIQITEGGDIEITSSGDIKLKADGDLQLEGANVSINSLGSLTATGQSEVSISSNGNTNIDGAAINLNSGISQSASSPSVTSNLNDYNE